MNYFATMNSGEIFLFVVMIITALSSIGWAFTKLINHWAFNKALKDWEKKDTTFKSLLEANEVSV